MHTFTSSGSRTVIAGETFRLHDVPANASIAVHPGAGGTASVSTLIDGNGELMPWPLGTVSASKADTILGPVAVIEFSAATADAKVEWRY